MLLDTHDRGISRTLILFGERELEHRKLLQDIIRPGMTIFDIGANIGYYVLMENVILNGTGRIVAIEPSPANVKLLCQNLALNNIENVITVEAAVSESEEDRELFLSEQSNLNSFHPKEETGEKLETIRVRSTTVPALVREYGPPDLIRMDVEGHEVEIINAMLPELDAGKMAPTIIFEVHRTRYGAERDFAQTLRRLFATGYRVKFMGSSQESGTKRLKDMGYLGGPPIATDFVTRVIFPDISDEDAISVICDTGGARTVVLAAA